MSPIVTSLNVDRYAGRAPTGRGQSHLAAPRFYLVHVTLETNIVGLRGKGALILNAAVPDNTIFEPVRELLVGRPLKAILKDLREFTKSLQALVSRGPDIACTDNSIRQRAVSTVLFALWDLWAKSEDKPLWRVIAEMQPQKIVDLIDFSGLTDALTEGEALDLLEAGACKRGRETRVPIQMSQRACLSLSESLADLSDAGLRAACRSAVDHGYGIVRLTLDKDLGTCVHQASIVRECIGPDRGLVLNANGLWSAETVEANMSVLADSRPCWIEDPLCPDDFFGYKALQQAGVSDAIALGKKFDSTIQHKQIAATGICGALQVDPRRLCGLAEGIAVLLLAAKFDRSLTFHCGFGPLAYAHHLAFIDVMCVGGAKNSRFIELDADCNLYLYLTSIMKWGRFFPPSATGMRPMVRGEDLTSVPTSMKSDIAFWETIDWSASNSNFPREATP